jgi:hypothetical protein
MSCIYESLSAVLCRLLPDHVGNHGGNNDNMAYPITRFKIIAEELA